MDILFHSLHWIVVTQSKVPKNILDVMLALAHGVRQLSLFYFGTRTSDYLFGWMDGDRPSYRWSTCGCTPRCFRLCWLWFCSWGCLDFRVEDSDDDGPSNSSSSLEPYPTVPSSEGLPASTLLWMIVVFFSSLFLVATLIPKNTEPLISFGPKADFFRLSFFCTFPHPEDAPYGSL